MKTNVTGKGVMSQRLSMCYFAPVLCMSVSTMSTKPKEKRPNKGVHPTPLLARLNRRYSKLRGAGNARAVGRLPRRDNMSKLADEIIKELFVNGNGENASRLVLTSADGHDLGGWSETGVRGAIKRAQHRLHSDKSGLIQAQGEPVKLVSSPVESEPL
jgi:hypothetical protein